MVTASAPATVSVAEAVSTPFHFFGVRHHGPGCARSLLRALDELRPDCLLVEGPPEGEEMLPLMLADTLAPPVALLVYNPEDAREAVFYPFAEFSPEWNALRHALARAIPARFIDLPVSHRFALARVDAGALAAANGIVDGEMTESSGDADGAAADETENGGGARGDPLDWLGRAAGHGDGETWWNHMVEERGDSLDLFAAIAEAMRYVRDAAPVRPPVALARDALREAHMRKCLRQARKEGFQRIAVVCGAWHVPALADMPPARVDNEQLKALPRVKVTATWVPWSSRNLGFASGYGAGVASPGWYEHLWRCGSGQRAVGWLARAARLFRDEGLDCSSAHLIEAARLADALAALRERPQPGLEELDDALRTVVCMGDEAPMRLIHRRLIVGERFGRTPETAPAVPLQRDLAQQQKSLRLKVDDSQKTLDLDLRQANDLARSHLFHRLCLLDIGWGVLSGGGRAAKGGFHELWTVQWTPELAVAVIDASRWGNSVRQAAVAKAVDRAEAARSLSELSELVRQVLLADLPDAIAPVTQALENLAAVAGDVRQLLVAIPPLTDVARYGNVRQTDARMVERLLDSLVPRAAIGLPGACAALDDDAAQALRESIGATHAALRLLSNQALRDEWRQALARLARMNQTHGLIGGQAVRLLFDDQAASLPETASRMRLALSVGSEPGPAAAWLEGFLNRSGMVLLHDPSLWRLVDDWLGELTTDHFNGVLPLLRRAFADFSAPERRQLGERAARRASLAPAPALTAPDWHTERAARALPLLRQLLGAEE